MKRNKLFWGLLIFCAINFAAHLCFYGSLPDVVPTHWGADGQANGWGPKSTVLIMAALPALMLILMAALPHIDPKHQNYEKFKGVWNASLTALTIFMSAMSWFSELSVFGLIPEGSSLVGILVCGGCGVLFIFLGNYMPRIKQNYMFGCKTPWALNNEHNWNRTQRMGGIVFVVMGAALIVISLLATILGDAATMILLLAYGYDMGHLLSSDYLAMELAQGIASTGGVVLTVPVASAISALVYTREKKKA